MNPDWPFDTPPSTACFTTRSVVNGAPILRVVHDYDGDWQFYSSTSQTDDDEYLVVSLESIVRQDRSILRVHHLRPGWSAERSRIEYPWDFFRDNPFPTFEEQGYYLEDAVWLSQYLLEIQPPSRDLREDVPTGRYVKLVFRFAAEEADREDGQCERIWVCVIGLDESGYYLGTVENEPQHAAAALGDLIHFHPRHIMDISNGV